MILNFLGVKDMEKALEVIQKYNMFKPGMIVGVAVSGGPDSMALLHYLHSNKEKLDIDVVAIHVNHCTRDNDDSDQDFVGEYCKEHRIKFYKFKVEALKLMKSKGMSMEEACREGRYGIFEGLKTRGIVDIMALAHHQGDQAETILLHIVRGAGLKGASGMSFVRDDYYVRPLLTTKKSEIMAYLYQNDVPFVEDETNTENIFSRNVLRNKVLPELRQIWPNVDEALCSFGEICRDDDATLNSMVHTEGIIVKKHLVKVPLTYFVYTKSILYRLLNIAFSKLGVKVDIEKKHIDMVIDLVKKSGTGAKLDLPHNITVYKEYEYLTIAYKKTDMKFMTEWPFKIGVTKIEDFGKLKVSRTKKLEPSINGLVFDLDKVPETAVWRMRREGDIITKFGGGTKKLKEYMIDKKIPARLRDYIPVLADSNDILIVAGVDISEKLRVTDATGKMASVEYTNLKWD